jgi:hypothetical protein
MRDDFDLKEEITYEKILSSLLNSEDLNLKTEIRSPQKLAGLFTYAKYLNQLGLSDSKDLLEAYIDILNEYMVSYERASRKEIIEAVRSMFEKATTSYSLSEKLTRNMIE